MNPEYTFRKISRRKYEKFVEMHKAKNDMKEIIKAITISETLYYKYLQTYENSVPEENKQKEDRVNNNQNGRSGWLNNKINEWIVKR